MIWICMISLHLKRVLWIQVYKVSEWVNLLELWIRQSNFHLKISWHESITIVVSRYNSTWKRSTCWLSRLFQCMTPWREPEHTELNSSLRPQISEPVHFWWEKTVVTVSDQEARPHRNFAGRYSGGWSTNGTPLLGAPIFLLRVSCLAGLICGQANTKLSTKQPLSYLLCPLGPSLMYISNIPLPNLRRPHGIPALYSFTIYSSGLSSSAILKLTILILCWILLCWHVEGCAMDVIRGSKEDFYAPSSRMIPSFDSFLVIFTTLPGQAGLQIEHL